MAHEINRLISSIQNTPLLTTAENLKDIQDYLYSRNAREDLAIASQIDARKDARDEPSSVENGVGLLTIEGSLTYKHSWLNSLCGIVSYQKLVADVELMIDQGAHTIVMDISSGGGMAHGCFEAAEGIRKMADDAGVRIVTYVDMMAASAAYALASISDEIIVNPMAKVGSIGVVVSIVNDLPKMIEEGTEIIFVYSGESKIPYDKDGKMRKDFISDLQKDTDALYEDFISHVEKYRPMTREEIKGTAAKTFRPDEAIKLGLADKEMTSQEFIDYLADLADNYNSKGSDNVSLFGWKKKKNEEMSEQDVSTENPSHPSESLEGIGQEGAEPSTQFNEEDKEVEMTVEEFMASPEGQAKLEEMAALKAKELSADLEAKLAALEKERVEAVKAEYKQLVAGMSFVKAEAKESVATFLYEASEMGMDGVKDIQEALEAAQTAVEAALDVEVGDEGESLEAEPEEAEKSAVAKAIEARYEKH